MTLQNIVTFDILSYYDGKIKNWVKALKATAEQDGIMTKEDFSKLAGIASGAQVNVIESVKVDGTALTPDANKAVNIKSKTYKNLMFAFAGESQARNKYTYFSSVAKKEGYVELAKFFISIANNEKEHAKIWLKCLNQIGSTEKNLKQAIVGEHEE